MLLNANTIHAQHKTLLNAAGNKLETIKQCPVKRKPSIRFMSFHGKAH